jgi:transposase
MASNNNQLNQGELTLYSMLISQNVVPVGVDLAARVFQVCYLTEKQQLKNKSLSRDAFLNFLKSPPFSKPMLVGFEACGTCNYFARLVKSLGHRYKIMPPSAIKSFLGLQKSDKIDALGIFRGALCPSIKSIKARDEENQVLMNLLTTREQLLKQQTQSLNAQRAMLYELGVVCDAGASSIDTASAKLHDSLNDSQSQALLYFDMIASSLKHSRDTIGSQLAEIDRLFKEVAKQSRTVQNLMTIPGIGVLSAITLYAVMGNPNDFPSSRHFASFAGFAPRNSGSGGEEKVGSIPHTGNKQLKKTLYMCAVARLAVQSRKAPEVKAASKLSALIENPAIKNKKIVCSIANRLARVAWSIVKSGEAFNPQKCRLLG